MSDGEVEHVRRLWRELAGAPGAFAAPGVLVVRADDHRLSPPGWIGVSRVLDATVVAVPAPHLARIAAQVARTAAPVDLTDESVATVVLGPAVDTLGPAVLLYGRGDGGAPAHRVARVALEHADVAAVLADATDAERSESGLADTTSACFVAYDGDRPAAVCAWRAWPLDVAHVCVLTATAARGSGCGASAARAALTAAVADGLLPQWRARTTNLASLALGRGLGLREVARQFSVRPPDLP